MPQDLINAKPVSAAVKEFFGSSQLSQFYGSSESFIRCNTQTSCISTWPGGLTRERAGLKYVMSIQRTMVSRLSH